MNGSAFDGRGPPPPSAPRRTTCDDVSTAEAAGEAQTTRVVETNEAGVDECLPKKQRSRFESLLPVDLPSAGA